MHVLNLLVVCPGLTTSWGISPSQVNLGVGVAVVEDHGEELCGGLQGGLLVHLEVIR